MDQNEVILSLPSEKVSNDETALLIFTRSLEAEYEEKGKLLNLGLDKFSDLYHGLLKKAVGTSGKFNLPTFIIDTPQQQGIGFGEKISNAIQKVFDQGYQKLIVLGNDCPTLEATHIRFAINNLKEGKPTIGPDLRGGVYLFSLQKNQFELDRFKELPWQQENLSGELRKLLKVARQLEPIRDVNSEIDLHAIRYSVTGFIKQLIYKILSIEKDNFSAGFQFFVFNTQVHKRNINKRGPPTSLNILV